MKKLLTIITAIILISSCKTERQLQMQTGTYSSYNGHVKFTPDGEWKKIAFDTTFRGFRVRNTSVKYQLTY